MAGLAEAGAAVAVTDVDADGPGPWRAVEAAGGRPSNGST
jgi:hypothetical protein